MTRCKKCEAEVGREDFNTHQCTNVNVVEQAYEQLKGLKWETLDLDTGEADVTVTNVTTALLAVEAKCRKARELL